jgi:hypothetical protein
MYYDNCCTRSRFLIVISCMLYDNIEHAIYTTSGVLEWLVKLLYCCLVRHLSTAATAICLLSERSYRYKFSTDYYKRIRAENVAAFPTIAFVTALSRK